MQSQRRPGRPLTRLARARLSRTSTTLTASERLDLERYAAERGISIAAALRQLVVEGVPAALSLTSHITRNA